MKAIYLFLLATFFAHSILAQWESCNISTSQYNGIWDIESHNGMLFASSNDDGLVVSSDNGQSWNLLNQSGFTTNPISLRVSHLMSAGTKLYAVTFNANYASSMVYVSTDNGQTFVSDTVGIPKSTTGNTECVNIDRIWYHNNRLVIDVANLGNWHKSTSSVNWIKNTDPITEYCELFAFHNGNFFTHRQHRTYKSTDNGQSWTQQADADLPTLLVGSMLESNPSTGRLYMAGKDFATQIYQLFYSDDEGNSWDTLGLNAYITNNWLGGKQTIQSFIANGDNIEFSLDNTTNGGGTHPSVFYSSNGGNSFAIDTAGLPANIPLSLGRTFVEHNGKLFMALSTKDAFKKDWSATSSLSESHTNDWNIYPNPFNSELSISGTNLSSTLEIRDKAGRLVKTTILKDEVTKIDLSEIPSGFYFVSISSGSNKIIKTLVKQ